MFNQKKLIVGLAILVIVCLASFYSKAQTQLKTMDELRNGTPQQGTMKYVDVKYGFKDIGLEQRIVDVQKKYKLKIHVDKADTMFFFADAKLNNVGDCNLKDGWVQIFNGKVMTIFFRTSSITESHCILQTLQQLFGNGFKDNQFMERYSWFGDKCTVMYEENSVDNSAVISISSKPLSDEYEIYLQNKAKNNGTNF